MCDWTVFELPASAPARAAYLVMALRQAAEEHRLEPDEVRELWDWIVDGAALKASAKKA